MKNLLSKLHVISVFFASLMITALCHASSQANDPANKTKTTIHVGISAPFSTESAFIGRNMLGAMELARDQLKSSEINYEFHTLDKMPNTAQSASVLQKFIDVHHINVILTDSADSGALVAPIATKNNLIHFCLTNDSVVADGKNNFLAQSHNHQQAAVLTKTMKPEFVAQFKQEYFSHPVAEAGYAYDLFHVLHNSSVLALKTNSDFSSQSIATHLLALESGNGVMGAFNLDKKGVSYKKQTDIA
ncbi:MAG: branched-chain amino acid ABC transporter substrate-binding protein [Legionella sp.]